MVLISHSLIGLALLANYMHSPDLFRSGTALALYPILTIIGALAIMRYFNILKINNHPIIYLSIHHVLLVVFIVFIAPINSTYAFMWLLLLFFSDFFLGKKGTGISFGVFLATLLGALFVEIDTISKTDVVVSAAQAAIIGSIAFLLTNTRQVSDEDRTVLVVSMEKAQVEHQRLLSLINSMGDAVISTDENGAIKLYNAAALEIIDTNETLDNARVQDFLSVVDADDKPVDLIALADSKNANIRRRDIVMKLANGDKMNLYVNVSPIKLGFRSKSERGFIMILRDITREKTLEEERDEFISVVSHELRTPITISEASLSNAMLIAQKAAPSDDRIGKLLEDAHKQTLFLANMINDLSTLSRAERNILEVDLERIDPASILKDIESNYLIEAKQKGLALTTKQLGDTPSITTSRLYLEEILQNFVTNALKYTRKGSITITLEPGPEKAITFHVIDTGIGISKSDQRKLFEKFFRSEDYRTRESSGTGLGLYVTLKLAKRIKGTIRVTSSLNEGSDFSITIPSLEQPADSGHTRPTAIASRLKTDEEEGK